MEHRIVYANLAPKAVQKRFTGNIFTQQRSLISVTACLILGLFIGALYFKYHADSSYYKENFLRFYSSTKGNFFSVLLQSVIEFLPYAAGLFLSGTCMAGMVLSPIITLLFGYNIGILAGYAYRVYALNGIVFHLLAICPWAVLTAIAILLSAREAIGFSVSIARLAFPGRQTAVLDKDFRLYCTRQLFVWLCFFVSALVRALLSCGFASFFQFS